MSDMTNDRAVRVLLFAPVESPSGGIAAWARLWLDGHTSRVEISTIDTSRKYLTLGSRSFVRRAVGGAIATVKRWTLTAKQVRGGHYDVVYLTCAPSAGFWLRDLPMVAVLARRYRVVLHLHGGDVKGFFGSRPWQRRLIRTSLHRIALAICITQEVAGCARAVIGADRVAVIPNMLRTETFTVGERRRPPSVLHVGWQSAEKGTREVLEVAARLSTTPFVLVGPIAPDVERSIERWMADLGRPENVTFAGELHGEELRREFASASVFLFPSKTEGFPMVILEAMDAALPIVATDVGAIAEMLASDTDDPAGFVVSSVRPDLVDALTAHLDHLLSDETLRLMMGACGLRRVGLHYRLDRVVGVLEEAVHQVVASPRFGA